MTFRKFLLFSLAGLTFSVFVSCVQTEQTEAITAEITAAQLEGRKAARQIVNREWRDTLELQRQLLEAKSIQSKYLIDGKKECAASFDSTFISTVRAVKPELAKKINGK